jgi:hypothetical protein
LNRLVQMIVPGESDLTWLQKKIRFNSLRKVYYYLEAARWARVLDETRFDPTSLGRRYVDFASTRASCRRAFGIARSSRN